MSIRTVLSGFLVSLLVKVVRFVLVIGGQRTRRRRRSRREIVRDLRDEPWGIRRFFVRDPSGRVVNVASHIA